MIFNSRYICAAFERIVADASHAGRNSVGRQARAAREGFVADAGHTVRDYGVFASCYNSI